MEGELVTDHPGSEAEHLDIGRVLVVIPTYNEARNIRMIVPRVRAATPKADILIVDDNSPDGTGDIADSIAATDPAVHVMHRKNKGGLGQAYLAGFAWASDAGYDVACEMDADGSHAPEQLPRLLEALRGSDAVIGSRYVPGGGVRNWSKRRLFLSRGANIYSRLALGINVRDSTGGFRAYRMEKLLPLIHEWNPPQGYCFQIDLTRRALAAGYRVVEVPITFAEREHGESKMDGSIVQEAFLKVTLWGVADRYRRVTGMFSSRKK